MSENEIRELVRKLQSPEALAAAEKSVEGELIEAGRRHQEILRRSRENAPRRVLR